MTFTLGWSERATKALHPSQRPSFQMEKFASLDEALQRACELDGRDDFHAPFISDEWGVVVMPEPAIRRHCRAARQFRATKSGATASAMAPARSQATHP